jgi:broad specificity phosphatase PhoE
MDRLLEAEGANGRNVALVTHGMFCRGFMHACLGRDPMEVPAWHNACVTVADYAPNAGWTVRTLACTAHLDEDDAHAHATGA